jgi:uncharacterized membrane protein YgdD (TMEM256/DUF423 family)
MAQLAVTPYYLAQLLLFKEALVAAVKVAVAAVAVAVVRKALAVQELLVKVMAEAMDLHLFSPVPLMVVGVVAAQVLLEILALLQPEALVAQD